MSSPGQPCVLDLRLDGVEVHLRAHVAWCQLYSVAATRTGPRRSSIGPGGEVGKARPARAGAPRPG
jgi:hypothetical protein